MTKLNYILLTLFATSLAACAYLLYNLIDQSISHSYLKASFSTEHSLASNLERILENELKGKTEAYVLQQLQKTAAQIPNSSVFVKKEEEAIYFEQLRFNFKDNRLINIGNP
jgi:outer membrane lipopolysaccharide assembly protein LptE/RlpB